MQLRLEGTSEIRRHIVFKLKLGTRQASVALRVADEGGDLEMSWRLFEGMTEESQRQIETMTPILLVGATIFALIFIIRGTNNILFFIGAIIVMGIVLYGVYHGQILTSEFSDEYKRNASRGLAIKVDHALFATLDELGVDRAEVRVIQSPSFWSLPT